MSVLPSPQRVRMLSGARNQLGTVVMAYPSGRLFIKFDNGGTHCPPASRVEPVFGPMSQEAAAIFDAYRN